MSSFTVPKRDRMYLLGNWDISDIEINELKRIQDKNLDFFNAKHGKFGIGYYKYGIDTRKVYIKYYDTDGLSLSAGLSELAAFICGELLDINIPNHCLDIKNKRSYQQEIFGSRLDRSGTDKRDQVSKKEYLSVASYFPIVGADDFRPPNLFINMNGDFVPIDLDSAMSSMKKVGEFYSGKSRKFKETIDRILKYSKLFSFSINEQEVLDSITKTSKKILNSLYERFYKIISTYRSPRIATRICTQIEDFANERYDDYNRKGKRRIHKKLDDRVKNQIRRRYGLYPF